MGIQIPETGYYGPGEPHPDDTTVHPFKIDVSSVVINDLKERLRKARITHKQLEDEPTYNYGFNLTTLEKYKEYWLNSYDWRRAEATLNEFPNFKTEIEGINLHFIHASPDASKYKRIYPILMSHGWPGSVYEFNKFIPIMVDPLSHGMKTDLAFHVVVPSIPGYGWSDAPSKSGLNQMITARMYNKLMLRLGYERYFVQGGDWGATIVGNISRLYPDRVIGCHVNMLFSSRGPFLFKAILGSISPRLNFSDSTFHNYSIKNLLGFFLKKGGYFIVQGNTPDTIGVGLNDSPLALMAWQLEKFVGGTNQKWLDSEDGNLEIKYSMHDVITCLMIYWVNGNALQAARFYKELMSSKDAQTLMKEYITVPTGYASCLNDPIPALPRELANKIANITHYTIFDDIGHFAALEEPDLLAQDVFKFVLTLV